MNIEWFDQCLNTPSEDGCTVFIEKSLNDPIGYATVLFKPTYQYFPHNTAELSSLFVLPSERRVGAGRALLKQVEEIAISREFRYIGLGVGVTRDYQKALTLYISSGYLPDGNGLYHRNNGRDFVNYSDAIIIDNSTTLWFLKDLGK